jgi:hypothetical protein
VKDWVSDKFEDALVWRCVNCGAITFLTERRPQPVFTLDDPRILSCSGSPRR